ncbi:MAG TPA: DNA-processing protein DprA [Candidatus Saccharimonadales bacterium]|nr:DNA-processing protein DprA [Candidatus Saccharimonadales bacterium]
MKINKLTLSSSRFPKTLSQQVGMPQILYHMGAPLESLLSRPRVAIVGSRSISTYGSQVTSRLAQELAKQGLVIVSGLAIGADRQAHKSALEVGGLSIAVLPSPLDNIVPYANPHLAQTILNKGGALVSEYPTGVPPLKQNFVARNRIVAGLSQAILITEASEKSGTLHTARFALDQGKEVLAIPGPITTPGSVGTNNLIKTGATLVTSYKDVLYALGMHQRISPQKNIRGRNANEQIIIDLMIQGISDAEIILNKSQLSIKGFNQAMTMLEVGGLIRALGANHWAIC